MNAQKFLVKVVLLYLLISQIGLTFANAQGPDEVETPIVIAPSGQLELTLQQLDFEEGFLNQSRTESSFEIDLPGNFRILPTGNYFELTTTHSPETPEKPATFQVQLNGRILSTFAVTADNAISNTLRIDVPDGLLRPGRNPVKFKLDTGATCEDPDASLDVQVSEDSILSFGYQQNPYPTDLSLYPFPFTERSVLEIPVTIVLPDQPTSNDLTAAATLAAGLGQMSDGSFDMRTVLVSEFTPEIRNNSHLIILGKADANPLFGELQLPLSYDSASIKPGYGVLEEVVSPWNDYRVVLVVSGLDDEGVSKANNALNRQAHFLGMRGPVAVVLELLPLSEVVSLGVQSRTLASLGYKDEVAYGALPQQYTYYFTLPVGWRMEQTPFFLLKFRHADILDPNQSIIDIKLNKVPIGSALLDDSNANEGELTISLPSDLLEPGLNRLQLGISMWLPDGDLCRDLEDQRIWTVISGESEIFLPYNVADLRPDLSLLPYPFSQSSGINQTMVILPDQPSSQMYNDLTQLAILLGSASSTAQDSSVRVAYASEVGEDIWSEYHLILLGRPSENALTRKVNASLPHAFVPASDTLKPLAVDSVAFLPDPERDAGLLEIAVSPWNEKNSLLAITGTTETGYRLALETLLHGSNGLKGNLAVVEPNFDPLAEDPTQLSTYTVDTRPPIIKKETSTTAISGNEKALLSRRWWK